VIVGEISMKTRFFADFDPNLEQNKAFVRDLQHLLRLSPENRGYFYKAILDSTRTFSSRQDEEILETLAQDTKQARPHVDFAFHALMFLANRLTRDEFKMDTPDGLAEDLRDLGVIQADEAKPVAQVIAHAKSELFPEYKKIAVARAYAGGVLPSLRSIGTTVELRPVIEPYFRLGMRPEEYKPKIVDQVPVISVHLAVDSGPVKEFVFQTSPDELEAIVQRLQATLMDLHLLEKRFPAPQDKKKAKKEPKVPKRTR
jgi:hypothetical protein